MSISHVAALLSADRKTVRGWLRQGGAPPRRKLKRGSILDPFISKLERRRAERCRDAMQLGTRSPLPAMPGDRAPSGTGPRGAVVGRMHRRPTSPYRTRPPPPSGRHIGRLLTAGPDNLADSERQFVVRLFADASKLAEAVELAKRLHRVLRTQGGQRLAVAADILLAGFAASLGRDQDALHSPWTTSLVEGQVKCIKTHQASHVWPSRRRPPPRLRPTGCMTTQCLHGRCEAT